MSPISDNEYINGCMANNKKTNISRNQMKQAVKLLFLIEPKPVT